MEKLPDTAPLTKDKTGLNPDTLAGEIAVVTGGTSNIGPATARCFAWLGAKVVIAARNPETALYKDFDPIRDAVLERMSGYMGTGLHDPLLPLVIVNRSEAPQNEKLDNSALW